MNKPENGNHQVNGSVILRDGELFHRKAGLGFFSKDIRKRHGKQIQVVEGWRVVWLPGETQELAGEIKQQKSTLIVGDLGAGKSALIYGLRAQYRTNEQPYCLVDGHFSNTNVGRLKAVLNWSQKNNAIVIWDSLDYLIGGSRKIRKISLPEHRARSSYLMALLLDSMDAGIALVGASHSESWIKKFGDEKLVNGPWRQLTDKMPIHKVRGVFEKPEEAVQFYCLAGLEPNQSTYLAHLSENPTLADLLTPKHYQPAIIDEVRNSLNLYRIAKLLALGQGMASVTIREQLEQFNRREIKEQVFLTGLVNFILEKNAETRQRMSINGH